MFGGMHENPQILVVDDEPAGVGVMARALKKLGRVQTATSAEEGWELAQATHFDLVVSDQRMPGMSGVELLGKIAEQDVHIGRILLTGYADIHATIDAINTGRIHEYVNKPCPPDQLRMSAGSVLERTMLARQNESLNVELGHKNEELEGALRTVRALVERVVESEKLSAIGAMIATVVHDFRAPLSVILSASREIVREESLPIDEVRELATQMVEEGDRMTRMCSELLDVTHVTVGEAQLEEENLADVLESALAVLLQDASHAGVDIDTEFEREIVLPLDEDRLRRAILNLGYNAVEAMPEGGRLKVTTRQVSDEIVISISDTGDGIPDEIRDRLFEPFVTSGKPRGSGLGLAIVSKVVGEHNGSVEVDKPEAGTGTVFHLRFPLTESV
jgi:signal transduction histidine kinase